MFDLKTKNAKIVDGTGLKPFYGEIAIIDNTIVERGKSLGAAKNYYDAEGLVLCPGFIDVHTHYDAQLTWDPSASPSLDLGVTTAIIGNCGFTIAPCKPIHRELNIKNLTKVEGMSYNTLKEGIDWGYESYDEYLSLLQNKTQRNFQGLINQLNQYNLQYYHSLLQKEKKLQYTNLLGHCYNA